MTNYWYIDVKTNEIVSPIFNKLSDLKDWNKQHRKTARNAQNLIIDNKEISVIQCRDKAQRYRGNGRF